jgi:hypothetical protein
MKNFMKLKGEFRNKVVKLELVTWILKGEKPKQGDITLNSYEL